MRGERGRQLRSAYHYDLWNMKYLPKFKWHHLTEEIAYEKVGGIVGGCTARQRGEGRLVSASL